MPTPFVTMEQEKNLLEICLAECRRKLDEFRAVGDKLQADMAEADLNRMLEELKPIYNHLRKRADARSK